MVSMQSVINSRLVNEYRIALQPWLWPSLMTGVKQRCALPPSRSTSSAKMSARSRNWLLQGMLLL